MRYGVASCNINPPFPTTMGGYAARQAHFVGVNDPLTFTAVVLEEGNQRALLAAVDLINWPNDGSTERLITMLASSLAIAPEQVLLNASHTHGGPKMPGVGIAARSTGDIAAAHSYTEWLFDRVLETSRRAAELLRPGAIRHGIGRTTLPMNRRRLVEGQIVNAPNPNGDIDPDLHVLVIDDSERRRPSVVIARASCHPVATGAQLLITSDFVGAWRSAIVGRMGPHVHPVFLQGAAGDMRPRDCSSDNTWASLPHAALRSIGQRLADETLAVINGPCRELSPLILRGELAMPLAECERRYVSRESLEPLLSEERNAIERRFARACIDRLNRGEDIPDKVAIRVQTLWLDARLALVGLNCEPLVALGRAIENAFSPTRAIVLGYTAGCMCYAPDGVELRRGGYEAESYLFEPWSGPWVRGFEETILPALKTQAFQK
jgi:hypothetical protein